MSHIAIGIKRPGEKVRFVETEADTRHIKQLLSLEAPAIAIKNIEGNVCIVYDLKAIYEADHKECFSWNGTDFFNNTILCRVKVTEKDGIRFRSIEEEDIDIVTTLNEWTEAENEA